MKQEEKNALPGAHTRIHFAIAAGSRVQHPVKVGHCVDPGEWYHQPRYPDSANPVQGSHLVQGNRVHTLYRGTEFTPCTGGQIHEPCARMDPAKGGWGDTLSRLVFVPPERIRPCAGGTDFITLYPFRVQGTMVCQGCVFYKTLIISSLFIFLRFVAL